MILTSLSEKEIKTLVLDCLKQALKHHYVQSRHDQKDRDLFLTKREAARLLSCSTSTIDNYARAGKLTRNYLGKTVRFRREEVLKLTEPSNLNHQKQS